MPRIQLQPSARLSAQARDDRYTTTEEELERLRVELLVREYPRIGDVLFWDDGYSVTVQQFAWPVDGERPLIPIVTVD